MQTPFKRDGAKFFDILEEVIEKEKTTVETVVGFRIKNKEERKVWKASARSTD